MSHTKGSVGVASLNKKSINEILLNKNIRARRVRFFHNGNYFFNGVVVPVSSDRYRSFDSLITDLTSILMDKVHGLDHGVQNIYTLEGRKVSSINQLEDGKGYVCCAKGETFKKVGYSELPVTKSWQISTSKYSAMDSASTSSTIPTYVKPRFVIVIRNGPRPRRIYRVLLNKRNALTMEQVLKVLTDSAHLDTGAVRKIFTLSGQLVTNLEEIFDNMIDGVFFIFGREKYTHDDFKLTSQENSILQMQKKMIRGTTA